MWKVRAAALVVVAGCGFRSPDAIDAPLAGSDVGTEQPTGTEAGVDVPPGSPARKKVIAIKPGQVTGTLDDFPIWLAFTDTDIASRAQSDGSDIFFALPDGTLLDYELARWDTQGHLAAWVHIPHLSAATTFEVHYGDPATKHPANPPAVFPAPFMAVWHLDDSLATTTVVETTGGHTGTAVGLDTNHHASGQLGSGISFDGGAGEIQFTNPLSGNDPHTISLWVSQQTTNDNDAMVVLGNGVCGQSRWFHSRYNAATIAVGFYCNDFANPAVDIIGDGFTLLHWVFDNNTTTIYRNGAVVAGPFTQTGTAIDTQGNGGHLGNAPGAWGSNMGLHGTLDEVRIAKTARTGAWIAAEYADQHDPASFYSVSAEEP
jgi:hypothetical protein